MDWRLALDIFSLIVGVVGLWIGVSQNRKARTARQAEAAVRRELHRQRAAEDFDDMARAAGQLALSIRSRDWTDSVRTATSLRVAISKATGSWSGVIKGFDKDKMEGAATSLKVVLELLPIEGNDADPQKVQEMLIKCDFVISIVSEIAGRLKYSQETE